MVSRRRGDRDGGRGWRRQDLVQVGDAEVDAGAQHDARLRARVVAGLIAGKNHASFMSFFIFFEILFHRVEAAYKVTGYKVKSLIK